MEHSNVKSRQLRVARFVASTRQKTDWFSRYDREFKRDFSDDPEEAVWNWIDRRRSAESQPLIYEDQLEALDQVLLGAYDRLEDMDEDLAYLREEIDVTIDVDRVRDLIVED